MMGVIKMTETITLDTRKCESTVGNARIAPLRRGERGNVPLVVFVRRNLRPYDLTDMTAHLVWKAADGKLVGPVPMEVTDPATGIVRCTLPDACYSTVGTARAYVELRRGAELVDTTDEMAIKVLDCIDADAEQAEEYKPLIAEVREAVADAKQATTEAYNAANVANEAAINANNAADRISAYTEIIEQNKKRITSLEGTVSKQGKQIANLQGIVATEETDSTEAYTKTVPTGAQKWASLDKVGGKTVVWNQLSAMKDVPESSTRDGVTRVKDSVLGTITLSGTAEVSGYDWIDHFATTAGHRYLFFGCPAGGNDNSYGLKFGVEDDNGDGNIFTETESGTTRYFTYHIAPGYNYANFVYRPRLVNLTLMFGAGNEPTSMDDPRIAFIKAYAEEHPEYNTGELMSAEVVEVESNGTFPIPQSVRDMCPGYGWSAGTACNEIDFERKVYVQRVGSMDLGTLEWVRFSNGRMQAFTLHHTHANGPYDSVTNCTCSKYVATSAAIIESSSPVDKTVALGENSNTFAVYDSDYTDADTFKSAMAGQTLYYELAEPIEVDLSDMLPDDHYIEVEAGGTVTFKQASTQLPVPSSVTYQISTSEVIANA